MKVDTPWTEWGKRQQYKIKTELVSHCWIQSMQSISDIGDWLRHTFYLFVFVVCKRPNDLNFK